jgi:hypothetical protein
MSITTDQILEVMPPQNGLFGLLFAFMNRLQAAGDAFYDEITCKQFFLLACMNLYQDEAPTANEMAETMGCSRQNVKEILNSLAKSIASKKDATEDDRKKAEMISHSYDIADKKYIDPIFEELR